MVQVMMTWLAFYFIAVPARVIRITVFVRHKIRCRPLFARFLALSCSLLAFELQRPHIDDLEILLYRAVSN